MSRASGNPGGPDPRDRSRPEPGLPSPAPSGENPQVQSMNWHQTQSPPGVWSDASGSPQQGYPGPLNMGHMMPSVPPAQQPARQGPGYPYVQFYPVYASGSNPQQRFGYMPQGYSQYQQQWPMELPGSRYPQSQAPYGYPAVPSSLSPPPASPAMIQAQGQPSPLYQYAQYGDPQQFVSNASTGSNPAMVPNSSTRPDLSVQTVPRGPPRKPRQSGHALWVGNLPQGATVVDLKDHFSQGAKADIESVKLISKSNCAFVNYRTREACAAAMERFHDSKFHGTRLVCRLRRSLPLSPNISSADEPPSATTTGASDAEESDSEKTNAPPTPAAVLSSSESLSRRDLPERFFVMKSLTLHDLEISIRTSMWATQAHNEETLNEAYEHSDHVYLFFSANKSGEYFGFARMASTISNPGGRENKEELVEASQQETEPRVSVPSVHSAAVPAETLPKAIVTPETENAPRGKIIDDMARGTIFWEADVQKQESNEVSASEETATASQSPLDKPDFNVEEENEDGNDEKQRSEEHTRRSSTASRGPVIAMSTPLKSAARIDSGRSGSQPGSQPGPQASVQPPAPLPSTFPGQGNGNGNAFRVEWLVVRKLPFYKCRGLRNPWNANREVKIARDGTEIETSVGQRLMALFGAPSLPFQQP